MAEVLASFFTNSAMSLHTTSLQAADGPPHGLGVFCLVLDPTAIAGEHFARKIDLLKGSIQSQPGTRLPGTGKKKKSDDVTVDSVAWNRALVLAGA
ncbi:LDH2 family malate/lactate/ureidoglycolate dehydrogenase [Arthrobacter sp. BE255]|nr:LDH2 family malate/lactate/ureidoglycolate dehydrogenase [Arthrobacter sp. BE255]